MEPKKNPELEVGRNSGLYFAIGLNLMLIFTLMLLEHKTYTKIDDVSQSLNLDSEFEEEIPITEQIAVPPPPPPPPAAAPEVISVVEDIAEIEESAFESLETSQDQVIEDRDITSIEEVQVEEVEDDIEVPFAVVERVPVFPGCTGNNKELMKCFEEKLSAHVKSNFTYPIDALELKQQGNVFVMFTIDKQGNITNMRSRGPYKILEKEAKRIIGKLPQMEPAKQRGKPVKVSYSLPIFFKIKDR